MIKDEEEPGIAGSQFEEFLREQDIYEDATALAVKRVLAFQLEQAMEEQRITKVEMAKRLKTSRSQLDRLLDPTNEGVSLAMLSRAANAVGRSLKVELV
ncbi:MAG: helix-turn-helix domain-containing protein [Pseudomonadota bacterium]